MPRPDGSWRGFHSVGLPQSVAFQGMFSGSTSGSTSRKKASRSGPVIGVKCSATARSGFQLGHRRAAHDDRGERQGQGVAQRRLGDVAQACL